MPRKSSRRTPRKASHKTLRKTPKRKHRGTLPKKTQKQKTEDRKNYTWRARCITSFMGTGRLEGIQELKGWRNLVNQIKELLDELPDTINGFPTRMWFIQSFVASAMINSQERQLDNLKELYKLVFGTRPRMDLKMMKSWAATLTKAERAQIQVKIPTRK